MREAHKDVANVVSGFIARGDIVGLARKNGEFERPPVIELRVLQLGSTAHLEEIPSFLKTNYAKNFGDTSFDELKRCSTKHTVGQ